MTAQPHNPTPEMIALLRGLADFSGQPADFWKRFVDFSCRLCQGDDAALYWRKKDEETDAWRSLVTHRATAPEVAFTDIVKPSTIANMRREGAFIDVSLTDGKKIAVAAVHSADPAHEIVLILTFAPQVKNPELRIGRIMALCQLPYGYEQRRKSQVASRDATRLSHALTLSGRVIDSESFDRATMVVANGLAEQFACETVSLTWRAREGQKLRAASHSEKLDRRSQASALIEETAQEALTQNSEVIWPGNDRVVNFAADRYATLVKPGNILTLPLIQTDPDGKTHQLGAIVLERARASFTVSEQWALRLHCEMLQQPLALLFKKTKWLPMRLAHEIGQSIPKPLRARTGAGRKLLAACVVGFIGILFVPIPFSITATALLKTHAMAFVGAPFDGFISNSDLILGDQVITGDLLFSLSDTELNLERNALLAELAQANRDAEIRRSLNQLSEMQVATAKGAEVTAQLLQIDQRLASAQAIAPISGVVVDGDPAKKIGEAVQRGEAIVTIAALSSLYTEAAVSERDLSFIEINQPSRLTLLAKPKELLEMSVMRIIPAANVQDGDNVFPVRMSPLDETPEWMLPGMTGVVKISVGNQPAGWVFSRRIIDYLRLFLWW